MLGLALALGLPIAPCPVRADADGIWSRLPPRVGPDHGFVLDPPRGRLLVIDCGGGPDPGLWAVSIDGGGWTELEARGAGPTGLRQLAAFYDGNDDRFIVVDRFSLDVWALSPEGDWTRITTTGAPRGLRGALTFDTRRGRPLLFGGTASINNEVWALALSEPGGTWSLQVTSGQPPEPRDGPIADYDPAGDRLVIHGGYVIRDNDANTSYTDTWALPLDTLGWRGLAVKDVIECRPLSWVYRPGSMVYDHTHRRFVRFRDSCAGTPSVATYTAGDTAWCSMIPAGSPPPSLFSDPVGDADRDRILVFGGIGTPAGSALFELTLGETPLWRQLTPAWPTPLVRHSHAATYEAARGSMFVTQGAGIVTYLDDTWELALGAAPLWKYLDAATPPAARIGATLVSNYPFPEELLLGGEAAGVLPDLFALLPDGRPRWTPWGSPGSPPPGLARHAAVALTSRGQMLVFGGYTNPPASDDHVLTNDTWLFDRTWRRIRTSGPPPSPREGHTAIYDASRGRVIVHGGDSGSVCGDTWAYSLADSSWTRVATNGPHRTRHTAVYDAARDRMVVCGGLDENGVYSGEVWAQSLVDFTWSQLLPLGRGPTGRVGQTAVYDPAYDRMVVYGGAAQYWSWPAGDTWMLEWRATAVPRVECAWTPPDAPGGDAHFTATVTSRMGAAQNYGYQLHFDGPLAGGTYAGGNRVAPGVTDTVRWNVPFPDSIEGTVRTTFSALCPGQPYPALPVEATLQLPMLVREALLSTESGHVRITWLLGSTAARRASVYRRIVGAPWALVGQIETTSDTLVFVDPTPPAGLLCAYRLGFGTGDHEVYRGEITFEVPGVFNPAELRAWPNPAPGALSVAFTMPAGASATLDFFDVSGRRVLGQEFGWLGAGPYVLRIPETASLDAGMYFMRLTRGSETIEKRVCLVR